MTRPFPTVAALVLGAALVLTGCQVNKHTCRGTECHVTTTGTNNTLNVNDWDVRVTKIAAGSATFSVDRSRRIRIPVGHTARVGDARIRVTSIEGETVEFDIR